MMPNEAAGRAARRDASDAAENGGDEGALPIHDAIGRVIPAIGRGVEHRSKGLPATSRRRT